MTSFVFETGVSPSGLRWARLDDWRILANAVGGYACMQACPAVRAGWCLTVDMPEDVERRLCAVLKIEYQP